MNVAAGSDHGVQASAASKPLSCITCRQRKVKCDKVNPCMHCQKAGTTCVFPNRVRVLRRGKGDPRPRDSELLQRISRLESLVGKIEAMDVATAETDASIAPMLLPSNNVFDKGILNNRIDDRYASFIRQQANRTKYLSGDFWTSICDEVDGLRQLLEHSAEDEDGLDDSTSCSTETKTSSPRFLFNEPGQLSESTLSYPSDAHQSILFRYYFANVDPVCKILHRPTAMTHFTESKQLLDNTNGRFKFGSIEAIAFAMYFTAVTSISPAECLLSFGESRNVLLAQYKRSTEVALTRADLMNTIELVTLQAFLLYIVAIRACDNSRSSWTLIGLAVRIAHGLGINKDGDGQHLSAFEAEMRRRLWWEIIVLDMRASEDRGSEPMILDGSFNTIMPCNINDEEFGYDSRHPLPDENAVTEISFCLMSMDVSDLTRKINFIPPTNQVQILTLRQKEDLVKQCTERIETHYLAGCDPNNPHEWVAYMIGRLLVLKLWLIVQYPLQSRQARSEDFPRAQSLRTSVAYMDITELIEKNQNAAGCVWFFKTYVPWHALAVALAELCNETHGPLADKAWLLVDKCYKKWSERVADTKEGMLWRPIKSLLKRAQRARQRTQEGPEEQVGAVIVMTDPKVHIENIAPPPPNISLVQDQNDSYNHMIVDGMALINQTPYLTFEDDLFNSMGMDLPRSEFLGDNINWNDWNEFILDVNTVGTDVFSGTL